MTTIPENFRFIITLSKVQSALSRKCDGPLGAHGLGLNDFTVLYHLSQAPEEKLRRVDLAQKMGITASGVTRLLSSMEKIGLVSRLANEHDARISYVVLAPSGKRVFEESLKAAQYLSNDLFTPTQSKKIEKIMEGLEEIGAGL